MSQNSFCEFKLYLQLLDNLTSVVRFVTHFINCMCGSLFCLFLLCNCVDVSLVIFCIVLVFTYVYVMCFSGQGRTAVADCLKVKYINQIKINQTI